LQKPTPMIFDDIDAEFVLLSSYFNLTLYAY